MKSLSSMSPFTLMQSRIFFKYCSCSAFRSAPLMNVAYFSKAFLRSIPLMTRMNAATFHFFIFCRHLPKSLATQVNKGDSEREVSQPHLHHLTPCVQKHSNDSGRYRPKTQKFIILAKMNIYAYKLHKYSFRRGWGLHRGEKFVGRWTKFCWMPMKKYFYRHPAKISANEKYAFFIQPCWAATKMLEKNTPYNDFTQIFCWYRNYTYICK